MSDTPPYLRFGNPVYGERLLLEVGEVDKVGFWGQLEFAAEVVRMARLAPEVPHVCRGSAGSSLLCYLAGISHIDPVGAGIPFIRFMGGRESPPDVDLDFPPDLRGVVWERIRARFGDRVGFLATELRYRSQGALREALRRAGIPYELWISPFAAVSSESRDRICEVASRLEGQQFGLARHCGGLVLFPDKVPVDVRSPRGKDPFYQLNFDKRSAQAKSSGKVDVLSNRGLSHLLSGGVADSVGVPGEHAGAGELFSSGDTWGIVQGESPAMRKLFVRLGVRNREGVILCLGLVRPAAGGGKRGGVGRNPLERMLVYEDDVTEFLGVALGCSSASAETARRVLAGGGEGAEEILSRVSAVVGRRGRIAFRGVDVTVTEARRQLGMTRAFAFCKAHATTYGHIVWALGVLKSENPFRFWEGFVNSGACASSMYLPWVHFERVKHQLGASVGWPGDCGLRPSKFLSVPWRFRGSVFGPDLQGFGFHFPQEDPQLWQRQLRVAGFWSGTAAPIPETWLRGDCSGRYSFRALSALKAPRDHPLEDGRTCLFSTLGHGTLGVVEWGRVFGAGEELPASQMFEEGEGVGERQGGALYVR